MTAELKYRPLKGERIDMTIEPSNSGLAGGSVPVTGGHDNLFRKIRLEKCRSKWLARFAPCPALSMTLSSGVGWLLNRCGGLSCPACSHRTRSPSAALCPVAVMDGMVQNGSSTSYCRRSFASGGEVGPTNPSGRLSKTATHPSDPKRKLMRITETGCSSAEAAGGNLTDLFRYGFVTGHRPGNLTERQLSDFLCCQI